jgi:hypothetical protein
VCEIKPFQIPAVSLENAKFNNNYKEFAKTYRPGLMANYNGAI